jgi:hypothetical protein
MMVINASENKLKVAGDNIGCSKIRPQSNPLIYICREDKPNINMLRAAKPSRWKSIFT